MPRQSGHDAVVEGLVVVVVVGDRRRRSGCRATVASRRTRLPQFVFTCSPCDHDRIRRRLAVQGGMHDLEDDLRVMLGRREQLHPNYPRITPGSPRFAWSCLPSSPRLAYGLTRTPSPLLHPGRDRVVLVECCCRTRQAIETSLTLDVQFVRTDRGKRMRWRTSIDTSPQATSRWAND